MNIQNIAQLIVTLLNQNDCVTIPGFGAFVSNPVGAQLDRVKNKFTPPSKQISFNKNILNNDGLLANALALESGVSYEDAVGLLKNTTSEIQTQLKKNGFCDFFQLGSFVTLDNGTMKFEANTLDAVDSFGLERFHLAPIKQVQPEVIPHPETVPVSTPQAYQQMSTWGKIGWAVAALPLITYLAWVPTQSGLFNRNHNFQSSDLNPFRKAPCEQYTPRPAGLMEINTNVQELLHEDFNAVNFHFSTPESTAVASPSVTNNSAPYHLIAGCFSSKENAETLIAHLSSKGYNPFILDHHKGLYRVTFGGYASQEEARKNLAKIKADNHSSAWLLIK